MQRRKFVNNVLLYSGAFVFSPQLVSGISVVSGSLSRHLATVSNSTDIKLPVKKRIPLGWPVFPLPANAKEGLPALKMDFPDLKENKGSLHFRITSAMDIREEIKIDICLAESNLLIASLDIKYAYPFQPFETPVHSKWINEIKRQGIILRMVKGTSNTWFYTTDVNNTDNRGLQPQLLQGQYPGSEKAFNNTLYSMNSFSPFGWLGGCVQDALLELHKRKKVPATNTLKKHLAAYLNEQKGIIFENPYTEPMDGYFNSIEDFLPFAAIVSLFPNHPSIEMAINFCLALKQPDGLIASGDHITTEGCYTLAYPLAQIAVVKNNRQLAETALLQLVHRMHYLSDKSAVYQRSSQDGVRGFRNWGRGVAWYVLGMAKTLNVIKNSQFSDLPQLPDIEKEFLRAIRWVSGYQNTSGMWNGYIDQPEAKIDTTTTSGIATAMVWAVRIGVLPDSYLRQAKLALKGLNSYLTADGFLTQVSQINRGGEALQRSEYRVITQFGLGLMAQLKAALNV